MRTRPTHDDPAHDDPSPDNPGHDEVAVERFIAAPAQRLFDIVADPSMHSVIDGSGTVRALRKGSPRRLSQGATFGIAMRIGVPYPITNTVVEFEEGRLLAWEHLGRARWRYRFEPVEGGTKVTESWDVTPSPRLLVWFYRLVGFPARNRAGIEQTLERLEAEATQPA